MRGMKVRNLLLALLCIFALPFATAALDDAEAYYSHDNSNTSGTTSEDLSGNNNDGTLNGGVTTNVTGILNEAYRFDGINDYVEITDSSGTLPQNEDFTVSAWVKGSETGATNIVGRQSGSNFNGWYLGTDNSPAGHARLLVRGTSSNIELESGVDVSDNSWHHVVGTYDKSTNEAKIYVDGSLANSTTTDPGDFTGSSNVIVGAREDNSRHYDGDIDEVGIWNRVLSSSEVADLYNSGDAKNPYTQADNFSVSAVDAFDNTTIQNFSLNLTGETSGTTYNLNTTTGTITTPVLANSTELWSLNVDSAGYQAESYTNVNVTTNTSFTAELIRAQSKFTQAKTKITNTTLTDFNITIQGNTFSSNTTFASPTSYNATFSKFGWYNKTQEYAQATLNQSFSGVYDQKLNITAVEVLEGATVNNFSGYVLGPNGFNESFNTTSSNAVVNVEKGYEYTVVIDSAPGFATIFNNGTLIMKDQFTTNNSSVFQKELETFTFNTVNFNVFDSDTSTLLSEDVNLSVINGPEDRDVNSNNGSVLVQDLLTGSYTARFETSTYATQDVFFTVKNSSYQEIDLYLDDTTTTVFFTVRDTLRDPVDDATVTMNTDINGTTVLTGQKSTDFSGTASFQLNPSKTYTFTVVADGFSTFEGTLTPTLTEYTVTLSELGLGVYRNPNQDFSYRTNVTVVNGTWTWTWKTTSEDNAVSQQNYSFVYDGVTYADTSTSSSGTLFTETGTVVQGQPVIEARYRVESVNGVETFTETFSLLDKFPVFEGFQNIQGNSGVVVQSFIATLVTAVLVVSLTLGAGITAGVYTGAVSLGFFGFFGFLPLSVTLISIASLITIGISLGRVRI